MPSPSCEDTNPHHVISSYFIGPKAENLDSFRTNIDTILTEIKKARDSYHPSDNVLMYIASLSSRRANSVLC